ncbi:MULTISPECIES: gliding motility lipoprotein GldH [Amniculibacterium]|uniref:gliding motility lipoprotein GldH n=1 Tax=Amniculibacterium TaxID=2715289 RepID=UPI000F5AA99F|nr:MULTISPECIES: gliding motility lipoprotein GldH [Amniculibacterium]
MLKKAFILTLFGLLTGCQSASEQVIVHAVDGTWDVKKTQNFDFEINDSQNPKNIIFVVRNNNDYPYSNIRFIVDLSDEKGKNKKIDTVNYVLAQPNGEWLGSGFGDTKEILFQYKLNYAFPKNGKYKMGIKQAMRMDKLPGIEDIGIKIEPAKH